MAVLAISHPNSLFSFQTIEWSNLIEAQSSEAKQLKCDFKKVFDRFEMVETYKLLSIERAFNNTVRYATASYLSNQSRIGHEATGKLLESRKFRKSILSKIYKEPIYMLNTPGSFIKDIWASFRALNAKKY